MSMEEACSLNTRWIGELARVREESARGWRNGNWNITNAHYSIKKRKAAAALPRWTSSLRSLWSLRDDAPSSDIAIVESLTNETLAGLSGRQGEDFRSAIFEKIDQTPECRDRSSSSSSCWARGCTFSKLTAKMSGTMSTRPARHECMFDWTRCTV